MRELPPLDGCARELAGLTRETIALLTRLRLIHERAIARADVTPPMRTT